jgi:multidrug efflux system membrane fusion protein
MIRFVSNFFHPVLLISALALAACSEKPAQAPAAAVPSVTIATPVKRTVTDWDEFTGRFEAVEQVDVRARVGGFVTRVGFSDGELVHKDDLLYLIDSRPYDAVAAQVDGQLADARARVELGKRELDRTLELQKSQNVAEAVVDQKRQALQAAEAAVLQSQAALKRAQLDIDYTHVLAPIDGRVSRHLVSVGNLVQGGDAGATLLTTLVSLDPIHLYFDMDEQTYLRNNKLWFEGKRPSSRDTPNPVQVLLAGETKPSHDGAMDFVDNRMDVSTGTLRVRARVPNHDLSILPGQFARARLIASSPYDALLIPDTAIASDQSRKIVFVVKDDDTVEAKPVMLGGLDEGLRIVKDGLKPEDKVIVEGLQRARVGQKVAPHVAQAASQGPTQGAKQ